MAGCTKDLHVFIYSGLIASYKPKPGERCICGEFSVEEMEAKGKSLLSIEKKRDEFKQRAEEAERQLAECQQELREAEQLASNNWELVQGLNKHCGNETAARQAAEQERDRLRERLEIIGRGAIENGWILVAPQFIEQALAGGGER